MQPAVRELHELISAEEIDRRVSELATEINEHYGDQRPLLIGVLNGAVIFMADLARKLALVPPGEWRLACEMTLPWIAPFSATGTSADTPQTRSGTGRYACGHITGE